MKRTLHFAVVSLDEVLRNARPIEDDAPPEEPPMASPQVAAPAAMLDFRVPLKEGN